MSQVDAATAYWQKMIDAGLRVPTTLEGLRAGAKQDAGRAESHLLKAEEIDAIRRYQSRGFRVIDLDPNLLDRQEFAAVYPSDIIANLTGENLTTTGIDSSGSAGCPNPYWRSFAFDCPGNWLKIEVMPVRQEVGRGISVTNLEQPISLAPSGTTQTENPAFIAEASRRTMLLDFEAPTSTPHIVSDGMVFQTYFSAFILTVKNLNTRIRITIGYNSQIAEREEKETTLALFGGRGITTRPQLAPTPFSITHQDVNTSTIWGVEYAAPYNTKTYGLIINPDNSVPSGTDIGGSVVWITSFDGVVISPSAATTGDGLMRMDLVLYEVNLVYAAVTAIKRVCSIQLPIKSGSTVGEHVQMNLAEPIRVSLPPQTGIFLRLAEAISPLPTGSRFVEFNLNGYVLGGFSANEVSGLSVVPYFTTDFLKENPWPMDYAFDGIPQR